MFKKTSFYEVLEFHCKIINSYAIYRCKKTVEILNCYLNAKKSYGTLSKGAIFFGQPCMIKLNKSSHLGSIKSKPFSRKKVLQILTIRRSLKACTSTQRWARHYFNDLILKIMFFV